MRRFDDFHVNDVAVKLAAANPLAMRTFVHEIDRLFDRMTFRYERTWQCRTQNWDQRLNAALQTWRLLEDYRAFVRTEAGKYANEYDALVREVYRYCDYMAGFLFEPDADMSRLKEVVGHDEQFRRNLSHSTKIHFDDLEAERDVKDTDAPRVLTIRHMNALLDAFAIHKFDVFLSYANRDEETVLELKKHLDEVPVTVWLDKKDLRPGFEWLPEAEAAIKDSSSVVVAIGRTGVGSSQRKEIDAALEIAERHARPVIPVLLPGASEAPPLGRLRSRTWVDFRNGFTTDGIGRLVYGITGKKADIP